MFGEPISNGLDVPRSDRCTFRLDSDVQKSGEILSATYPGKNFNFTKKKEIREIKIIFYFFPGTYPKDLHCSYQFVGKPNQRLRIEFRDFDLFYGGAQ